MMSQREGGRVPVVSPFSDPTGSPPPEMSPQVPVRQVTRSSPLNPNQVSASLDSHNGRMARRSLTSGSNSTQPPSRNSEVLPLSSSGSGSSESGELQDIQAHHVGADFGPYPVSFHYQSFGNSDVDSGDRIILSFLLRLSHYWLPPSHPHPSSLSEGPRTRSHHHTSASRPSPAPIPCSASYPTRNMRCRSFLTVKYQSWRLSQT